MPNIYTSADQLVGHTPLLELTHIEKAHSLKARVLAKLEYFNPAGSVKDRVAVAMLDDAEKRGVLKPTPLLLSLPPAIRALVLPPWRLPWLPCHHCDAGDHERGAAAVDACLRRGGWYSARAPKGMKGAIAQGGGAGEGIPQQLHSRPVCQPR